MSELQVLTIITTILGLVATVLNLVAFVREKDKRHTRAGLLIVSFLAVGGAIFFLPHYAPETARGLVSALPDSAGQALLPWLGQPLKSPEPVIVDTPTPSATPVGLETPLQGSFAIEIQRNFLGGIGALMAKFTFANLADDSARVTAYHIAIVEKKGESPHRYDRVLAAPIDIGSRATVKSEVELDPEIRDHWVAWHDVEPSQRGSIEIRWEAQDAKGRRFSWSSTNG